MIRADTDIECDKLRAKVSHLQEQIEALQGRLRNAHSRPTTAEDADRIGSTYPHTPLVPELRESVLNYDSAQATTKLEYHCRMLHPTFRVGLPATRDSGFLSSPWHLWDGLASAGGPDDVPSVSGESLTEEQRRELVDTFFHKR